MGLFDDAIGGITSAIFGKPSTQVIVQPAAPAPVAAPRPIEGRQHNKKLF